MAYNSQYTGAQVEELLESIGDKANASDVYTQKQVDNKVATVQNNLNLNYYTAKTIDSKLSNYAKVEVLTQDDYDDWLASGDIDDDTIYIITEEG
jgi:peptidoglycan hydrolase-like protein with peptidoglycan-binding domain